MQFAIEDLEQPDPRKIVLSKLLQGNCTSEELTLFLRLLEEDEIKKLHNWEAFSSEKTLSAKYERLPSTLRHILNTFCIKRSEARIHALEILANDYCCTLEDNLGLVKDEHRNTCVTKKDRLKKRLQVLIRSQTVALQHEQDNGENEPISVPVSKETSAESNTNRVPEPSRKRQRLTSPVISNKEQHETDIETKRAITIKRNTKVNLATTLTQSCALSLIGAPAREEKLEYLGVWWDNGRNELKKESGYEHVFKGEHHNKPLEELVSFSMEQSDSGTYSIAFNIRGATKGLFYKDLEGIAFVLHTSTGMFRTPLIGVAKGGKKKFPRDFKCNLTMIQNSELILRVTRGQNVDADQPMFSTPNASAILATQYIDENEFVNKFF